MRTETSRIRQLPFQPGHAPGVLTRRALAALATALSHPLSAGRSRSRLTRVGGVIAERADRKNCIPVFLYSQEKAQFVAGPKSEVSAPEMR
jgi:hypothetical protein